MKRLENKVAVVTAAAQGKIIWFVLANFVGDRVTRRFEKNAQYFKKEPQKSPMQKRPKYLQ
jgi:hypothetical protein